MRCIGDKCDCQEGCLVTTRWANYRDYKWGNVQVESGDFRWVRPEVNFNVFTGLHIIFCIAEIGRHLGAGHTTVYPLGWNQSFDTIRRNKGLRRFKDRL